MIDESKNKIIVNLINGQEINLKEMAKHVDLRYFNFEHQSYALFNKNVDLGKRIRGYMTGIQVYSNCSTGFFAKDSVGYDVLVTAGHCDRQSFPSNWYNGSTISSQYYIGNFTYKKTTNLGEIQYSDSGYIRVTNDTNMINTIVVGSSTIPLKYVNNRDEITGEYIYRKGYVSGVGSGQYVGGICILDYADPDINGYVCDLAILSGLQSIDGDSGGTVFKINSSGEATLFGILTAGLDSNNDGTKVSTVYSRIKYITSELGLSAIYLSN